jgi:hypothetical protein
MSSISCIVFFKLYIYGNGMCIVSSLFSSLANLYAGAFVQPITGRIGQWFLCTFIWPRMVGAEGFKFMYLDLFSFGMEDLHSLITVLILF